MPVISPKIVIRSSMHLAAGFARPDVEQAFIFLVHTRAELDELCIRMRRDLKHVAAADFFRVDLVGHGEDREDVGCGYTRLGHWRREEDVAAKWNKGVYVQPCVSCMMRARRLEDMMSV
jgi:hypothetical protein